MMLQCILNVNFDMLDKGRRPKQNTFYGQANSKGGGGGEGGGLANSALTVSKCENFDPFFY